MTAPSNSQRILRNAGWLTLSRGLAMAASFIVGISMARHLGRDQFGSLIYVVTWISLFSSLAGLGLAQIAVRELTRRPEAQERILGTVLALRLLGGSIGFAMALTAAYLFHSDQPDTWILIGIAGLSLPLQVGEAFEAWLLPKNAAKHIGISRLSATLIAVAVKLGLIVSNAGLSAFVWAGLIDTLLASLLLCYSYVRLHTHKLARLTYDRKEAIYLLREAWPILLSGLAITVYARVDQILLGHLSTHAEVGLYGVAVILAESWYFIPLALITANLPYLSECEPDSPELQARLRHVLNQIVLISYAIAIPISLAAIPLVSTLYGRDFAGAGVILAFLALTGIFAILSLVQHCYLTLIGAPHVYTLAVLIGGICNITMNLVLIPDWGGVGAGAAKLFSYWLAAHGCCFVLPRLLPLGKMMSKALLTPRWQS
jgi:O-antigen/teichoic acid export membrane protein